jgi:D-alanyl-D-alanine carboxypeptidase
MMALISSLRWYSEHMSKRFKSFAVVTVITCVVISAAFIYAKNTTQIKPTEAKTQSQIKALSRASGLTVQLPGADFISRPAGEASSPNSPQSLWVVVNKQHPLANEQFMPPDLVLAAVPSREDKTLEERSVRTIMQQDLVRLFTDARAQGYELIVASGFRSYSLQQAYFTSYSKTYGEAAALTFSARPGQSEHQTGLAVDISLASRECYLDECFGTTAAGKWLAAQAYKYGFILRYPADKTAVTNYQYEPWHFRYVGADLARALQQSDLTLDEARQYLQ